MRSAVVGGLRRGAAEAHPQLHGPRLILGVPRHVGCCSGLLAKGGSKCPSQAARLLVNPVSAPALRVRW